VKLTPDQLVLLGCGTKDRARKDGGRTLCFLADVRGTPVVAIVICPSQGGDATWVTTLDVPETGRAWKADPFAVVRFRGTRREKGKLRRTGGFGLRAGRAAGRRSPETAAAGVRGANEGIRTRIGSLGAAGVRTA
jgi:hypothetical protein